MVVTVPGQWYLFILNDLTIFEISEFVVSLLSVSVLANSPNTSY